MTLIDRGGAARHDGVPLHEDAVRARAGGGSGLLYLGIVNAPHYATVGLHPGLRRRSSPSAARRSPRSTTRFLIVGIDGGGSGFAGFKLRSGASARRRARRPSRTIQNLLNENRRRAGLRVRAAVAARRRRRPADPVSSSARSAIPPRSTRWPRRSSRRRTASRASSSSCRTRCPYADAARAHHHRPRPRGGARRAGQRDRHDARRPGRRRVRSRSSTGTTAAMTWSARSGRPIASTRSAWPSSIVRARRRLDGAALGAGDASRPTRAPAAIEQFNQLNSATLSALPLPGVTTSEGLATLRADRRGGDAAGLLRGFRRPVAAGGPGGQLDRCSPSGSPSS